MSDDELAVGFNERMVGIRHIVKTVTGPETAHHIFRELKRECVRIVPKFRAGHTLFARVVPDVQLSLWEGFAEETGKKTK